MKAKPVEEERTTPEEQVEEDLASVEETLAATGAVRMEPAVLTVRRQFKENGTLVTDPEEESEEIAVHTFLTDPAHASLRINHTNNMDNYWSMSIQVGLDVPHYIEEHKEAWEFVVSTLTERLGEEIAKGQERVQGMRKRRGGHGSNHPF